MRRSLYAKFIIAYVALAVLILTAVATLGSYLVERELISQRARALYDEANAIATTDAQIVFSRNTSADTLERTLQLIGTYQDANIWILNTEGAILFRSDKDAENTTVDGFDAASFGPDYYEISDFYGNTEADTLHVLVPITQQMRTRGYVAIHEPMTEIYTARDQMMRPMLILAVVFIILSFIILAQFTVTVYRPLVKITEGAVAYSSGNLHHRIEVTQSDEIGYLAQSMNMMASDIERANAYQDQFVANISHDFRSPLTSIKGFTEAMIDGTIPPENHEKYLKVIGQEADRLENMTQSVLSLSNVDIDTAILHREDFDINEVIRDTAALFEGSCQKKRITLDLVLTGDTFMVNADIEKIKQVLYNLLDNAIKFSDKDSSIKIETEEKYDKCYVSVKDNGCGISKNDLSRIWNRFYKSDYSRGRDKTGSGLGLSIVKEIMKAHGQNINVVSTEGVGTEFVFTLDIPQEPEDEDDLS